MMGRFFVFASLLAVCTLTAAQGQVAQLGRTAHTGQVSQASFLGGGCDGGCAVEPSCGAAGPSCGLVGRLLGGCAGGGCDGECDGGCFEPSCGAVAPSCGSAGGMLGGSGRLSGGGLLGGLRSKLSGLGNSFGGEPSCGLPEPSCGSIGLGYSGGFGGCSGGDCDSCGVGGYFGRNLHQVNPCACGGSLVGDTVRGLFQFVDKAVGTLVDGVFSSFQAATCHASGTFAALSCATQAACTSCDGGGCDGGCAIDPGCGLAAPDCGCQGPIESYGSVAPSQPVMAPYAAQGVENTYAPRMQSTPIQAFPIESESAQFNSVPTEAAPMFEPTPVDASAYGSSMIETVPMDSAPVQTAPVPAVNSSPMNPFMDDPISPQARAQPRIVPTGFRYYNPRLQATQPRQLSAAQQLAQKQAAQRQLLAEMQAAQRQQLAQRQPAQPRVAQRPQQLSGAVGSAVRTASATAPTTAKRYLPQTRGASLRR